MAIADKARKRKVSREKSSPWFIWPVIYQTSIPLYKEKKAHTYTHAHISHWPSAATRNFVHEYPED